MIHDAGRGRRVSVRAKLVLACGVLAVLTGTVGLFALWALSSAHAAFQVAANASLPAIHDLEQAGRDMLEALVAERSLMFMKMGAPDADALVKRHEENLAQVEAGWRHYIEIEASDAERKLWPSFTTAWAAWTATSREVVKILGEDTPVSRRDAIDLSMAESAAKFAAVRVVLDDLTRMRMAQANVFAEDQELRAGWGWWAVVGFVACACAFAVIFAVALARSIARPLGTVAHALRRVADGDLTVGVAAD